MQRSTSYSVPRAAAASFIAREADAQVLSMAIKETMNGL